MQNRLKLWTGLCFLSTLLGYLEWSGGNKAFLLEAEWSVFKQLFQSPQAIVHPFILLPLLGQLFLLVSLFLKTNRSWLLIIAICCLGLLFVFLLIIGIMTKHIGIVLSTLPFFICSFVLLKIEVSQL